MATAHAETTALVCDVHRTVGGNVDRLTYKFEFDDNIQVIYWGGMKFENRTTSVGTDFVQIGPRIIRFGTISMMESTIDRQTGEFYSHSPNCPDERGTCEKQDIKQKF